MKIDLVYLWCDGSDAVWREKRESYLPEEKKRKDTQTFYEGRILENDELRYSLRSVEMYAPWINHIYIVTDNQCPTWLDTTNPKITLVNQADLLPKEVNPIFNSCAIELVIHKIEGLSEYYLYANDDMMFAHRVQPDFFFSSSGRAKCRFVGSELTSSKEVVGQTYEYTIMRANEAISLDFDRADMIGWQPHHNIDAYKKSSVERCLQRYQEWNDTTIGHRFRTPDDMQRHLLSLYAVATGDADAVFVKSRKYRNLSGLVMLLLIFLRIKKGTDSRYIDLNSSDILLSNRLLKPQLVCFNDDPSITKESRVKLREVFPRLYPKRSKFEL